jgi:hypothetical protein
VPNTIELSISGGIQVGLGLVALAWWSADASPTTVYAIGSPLLLLGAVALRSEVGPSALLGAALTAPFSLFLFARGPCWPLAVAEGAVLAFGAAVAWRRRARRPQ